MAARQLFGVVQRLRSIVLRQHAGGMTDGRLLELFLAHKDEAAFEALVRRHGPMVLAVCRRILHNFHDAEDAFQATFLVLVRKAGSIRPREMVGNWLYGVAYRTSLEAKRAIGKRLAKEKRVSQMAREETASDSSAELRPLLDHELERLPDKYRAVLVLCDLEGKSRKEVAQQFGLPEGTVASRLPRAREMLAKRLTRRGLALSGGSLAVALCGDAASACVPTALVVSTTKAATGLAAGNAATTVVSAQVVAMTEGVMKTMLLSKLKMAPAIMLLLGVVATTAGFAARHMLPAERSEPKLSVELPEPKLPAEPPRAKPPETETPPANRSAVIPNETKPFGPVRGVVKDSAGQPVAGATVALKRFSGPGKPAIGQTGADGSFTLAPQPGDRFDGFAPVVLAAKEGFAPALGYSDTDGKKMVNLELTPTATVSGAVQDREGRSVEGARVQFGTVRRGGDNRSRFLSWGYASEEAYRGTVLEPFFIGRSDAQGKFRFTTVPADRELIFRAEADGFAVTDTGAREPQGEYFAKPDAPPVTLVLLPEARVNGRVVSRVPGAKPDGLRVWLRASDGGNRAIHKQTWTDAAGGFVLRGLPEGTFHVQIDQPPDGVTWTVRAAPEVTLRPGATSDVEIELIEGISVEGTVVVADTGEPVAGTAVLVYGPSRPKTDPTIRPAITDPNGRYRLRLPPGNHEFCLRGAPKGFTAPPFGDSPVTVPEGVKTFAGPTLTLERATTPLERRMPRDGKTYFEGVVRGPDGKPVANALVRANPGPKMHEGVVFAAAWTDTRADATGRYRLDVEADAYEFLVKAPGVGVARLPKTLISRGQARPLDIRLQPGITFQAVTVDAQTDQRVAGVLLWSRYHKDMEGRSDANGELTILEMVPGRFQFNVEAAGYTRWWSDNTVRQLTGSKWQRNFDDLDLDVKEQAAPVKILLEKGVRIMGRVIDPDGKPVAGATVAPALTGTDNSLTGDTRFSVETNAEGTFQILLPASGLAQYNLVAHDGKYQQWRHWANGVLPPIQTVPGQEIKNVTLTLTRPATVRGKVVDVQGKPVAHRSVRARAVDELENRYYEPTTSTNDDGTFELRFIRPGEHFIEVAPFWQMAGEIPDRSTRRLRLIAGETVNAGELVGKDNPR